MNNDLKDFTRKSEELIEEITSRMVARLKKVTESQEAFQKIVGAHDESFCLPRDYVCANLLEEVDYLSPPGVTAGIRGLSRTRGRVANINRIYLKLP